MKHLRAIFAAVLIGLMVSAGAFAQKGKNDNRPPKEDQKIKENPKPPPSNSSKRKP
jgi:Spy/CpxP family protein refolding chaperone